MKPSKFPKEQRDLLIGLVQEYFETERGETLGHLAAEGVLDFLWRPWGLIYTIRRSATAGPLSISE